LTKAGYWDDYLVFCLVDEKELLSADGKAFQLAALRVDLMAVGLAAQLVEMSA